jgi:hypothetical protein
MKAVPGKEFKATATPSGHIPVYCANGFPCYLISIGALFLCGYTGILDPADIYDHMGTILSSLNVFGLLLCLFLMVKGLNFPSTEDSGTNGNLIVDYFWGTELYPRIFGWDVKQFTNCRFGMMSWQLLVICYAFKQYQLQGESGVSSSMLVSVLLQTVYVAKFFWWETGYFCSMDIQHDRAGYYLCWGCLVWVPGFYTIHTYFMVEHPVLLSLPITVFMIVVGILCIWINYDCDRYLLSSLPSLLFLLPPLPSLSLPTMYSTFPFSYLSSSSLPSPTLFLHYLSSSLYHNLLSFPSLFFLFLLPLLYFPLFSSDPDCVCGHEQATTGLQSLGRSIEDLGPRAAVRDGALLDEGRRGADLAAADLGVVGHRQTLPLHPRDQRRLHVVRADPLLAPAALRVRDIPDHGAHGPRLAR